MGYVGIETLANPGEKERFCVTFPGLDTSSGHEHFLYLWQQFINQWRDGDVYSLPFKAQDSLGGYIWDKGPESIKKRSSLNHLALKDDGTGSLSYGDTIAKLRENRLFQAVLLNDYYARLRQARDSGILPEILISSQSMGLSIPSDMQEYFKALLYPLVDVVPKNIPKNIYSDGWFVSLLVKEVH